MGIILLNILSAQITMGCKDMELSTAYLLRKLTRVSARASARALVWDYKPESLAQLKQCTFATSVQATTTGLQACNTGSACYF